MHIGVDARHLTLLRTGVETYARLILEALAHQAPSRRVSLLIEEGMSLDFPVPARWQILKTPASRLPFFAWPCPRVCRRAGIDVFYSPVTAIPLWGVPSVCTIYDLLSYRYAKGFPLKYILSQRIWFNIAARRALRFLTISENTRKDLESLFPRTKDRISVVPAAVDPFFCVRLEPDLAAEYLKRLGIDTPFILTVGSLQPRKNLNRLIRAYEQLRTGSSLPHQLIVVGQKGWLHEGVDSALKNTAFRDSINVTGYISQEELKALYETADLFVLPSLYEGFGIPILEAMACGTPVACSGTSSFPEVGGDAALYFDPRNVESIAGVLARIIGDQELKRNLVDEGHKQVRFFSWQRSARLLLRCLEEALQKQQKAF